MTDLVKNKFKTVTPASIRDSLEITALVSIFILAIGGVVPTL